MDEAPYLTPAELERLSILAEELGEAIQAVGKVLRHGYNSFHPERTESNNRIELAQEIGHVSWIVAEMYKANDLNFLDVEHSASAKALRITNYLHHQSK